MKPLARCKTLSWSMSQVFRTSQSWFAVAERYGHDSNHGPNVEAIVDPRTPAKKKTGSAIQFCDMPLLISLAVMGKLAEVQDNNVIKFFLALRMSLPL